MVSVSRSDRDMSLKLFMEGLTFNIVSACAPQIGCAEEKEEFWEEMDQSIGAIPPGERVLIGADLNGHIGRDGVARAHGEWGAGENEGGQRITVCHGIRSRNNQFPFPKTRETTLYL